MIDLDLPLRAPSHADLQFARFKTDLRPLFGDVEVKLPPNMKAWIEGPTLMIAALVTNSYRDEKIVIQHGQTLPPHFAVLVDLEAAKQILRRALHRVVTHEVDEFLMFDGERTFDPHAVKRD